MVFCNYRKYNQTGGIESSHNPYFNRWFSAIWDELFSYTDKNCHNPYFNRWFSAMKKQRIKSSIKDVTILILIDGFLQYYSTTHMH